jgi:hypothetical protein
VFYDHLYEEGGLRQVRGEGGCTNAGFDRVGGALLGFCVCKRGGGLCLHPDTPGHSLRHPCMLHDYFTNRVSHLVTHMVCPMLSAAPPQCILDLLTLRQKHGLDCRAKVTVRRTVTPSNAQYNNTLLNHVSLCCLLFHTRSASWTCWRCVRSMAWTAAPRSPCARLRVSGTTQ